MKTTFDRAILLLSLLAMLRAANAMTIADTEFNANNWTEAVLYSSGDAAQSAARKPTGGNPGAYRHMTHVLPASTSIGVAHRFLGASYDPASQGAIDSLDYTEDHIELSPPFTGAAIGATPALFQGGTWFFGPDLTFSNLTWQSVVLTGLTASDFSAGGSNPDFSAAGDMLYFGFWRSNSNSSTTTGYTTVSGIDNWSFTIHGRPPAAVPAPAAIWLFGTGLIGLFVMRRKAAKAPLAEA